MRKKCCNPLLLPAQVHHQHAKEMETISDILKDHPRLPDLVEQDLLSHGVSVNHGRPGLTGEQVLRIAILKAVRGFSYEELVFTLRDSATYRRFCRLSINERVPCSSTLQDNIVRLKSSTWRTINQALVSYAQQKKIERANKVRIDATVVETHIHPPDDAAQLWDVVRVLTRLLQRAKEWGHPIFFHKRTKRAKRRRMNILYAKKRLCVLLPTAICSP